MVEKTKEFWNDPDKMFKVMQIALLIGMAGAFYGQARAVASSSVQQEARLVVLERQAAETAALTKQTAEILETLVANLRMHEIEDAAVTATVKRNTEILNTLTARSK